MTTNFSKRLDRLPRTTSPTAADAIATHILGTMTRGSLVVAASRELPGKIESFAGGRVHRIVQSLDADARAGAIRVADAQHACAHHVADLALDARFEDVDFSKILFLDTETTGLSTASGTRAFLIACAYFRDGALVVEQLFLPTYGDEPAMLEYLAELIARASVVCSYNGKSFDWPLLRTRFVMNRVKAPVLPPHLDLLHCSRRLFKHRLERVRLVDMERELLQLVRTDDTGGALIPPIYLHYVRTGSSELPGVGSLHGVIEHNHHDVVALPAILAELLRQYDTLSAARVEDHVAFARVAERAGDNRRAGIFATKALAANAADDAAQAHLVLARIAQGEKDFLRACECYEAAARLMEGDVRSLRRIAVAISKLYEHRFRDFERAHQWAERAEDGPRASRIRRKQSLLKTAP